MQHPDRGARLVGDRRVGVDAPGAGNGHDLHVPHRCRRRRGAPRPRAELGRGQAADAVRGNRRALGRFDLGRVDQSLGAREDRGQADLGLEPAVVVLATRGDEIAVDREVSHPAQERQVAHVRELWRDLTGVGVDGVAAGEHEIERTLLPERGRERLCGGEGVGSSERRVGDEHTVGVDLALGCPTRWPRATSPRHWGVRA